MFLSYADLVRFFIKKAWLLWIKSSRSVATTSDVQIKGFTQPSDTQNCGNLLTYIHSSYTKLLNTNLFIMLHYFDINPFFFKVCICICIGFYSIMLTTLLHLVVLKLPYVIIYKKFGCFWKCWKWLSFFFPFAFCPASEISITNCIDEILFSNQTVTVGEKKNH
jgi:hypothetical protein